MFAHNGGKGAFHVRSDIWEMDKAYTPLKVENIVVSGLLTGLPDVEKKQEQSKYSKFPHILHISFPHRDYSCKVFLYSRGIMNLVGIKCYEDIATCVAKAYQYILRKYAGHSIYIKKLAIHNIVASGHHESNIKLELLEKMRKYAVVYQPHKFPGAYLREGNKMLGEHVTVFKLFRPGSTYTVGGDNHASIVRNGERLPGYVDTVSYNHVCTMQFPPPYSLHEVLAAVNSDPVFRSLCGEFEYVANRDGPQPYIKSRPFFYPGAWNVERMGPRLVFTTYISRDGLVSETATRVRGSTFTSRQRGENASRASDHMTGLVSSPAAKLRAQQDEDGESEGEGGRYSDIPLRSSTLISSSAVALLMWSRKLACHAELRKLIGRAEFKVQGVHFYIRTTRGVTMHGDGDLNFPSSLGFTKDQEKELAVTIWQVCGFVPYKRNPVPEELLHDGRAPSINMKKAAADLNRERIKCRYEPLANIIRFEMGALLDSQGAIWKPASLRVNLQVIWRIVKIAKDGKGAKRKRAVDDES